jgi:hypothetical protein
VDCFWLGYRLKNKPGSQHYLGAGAGRYTFAGLEKPRNRILPGYPRFTIGLKYNCDKQQERSHKTSPVLRHRS